MNPKPHPAVLDPDEFIRSTRKKIGIELGLERIKACLEYLGNPQKQFKSVLIGGTNGKGSVTFYLSNLFNKFTDLKIGRYIRPHLIKWNERFVISEQIINNELLGKIVDQALPQIISFEKETNNFLTEFEVYTVIAFCLFAFSSVELAFLEVGMGGRFDATNVVDSENVLCSVITNVAFDHMEYLGDTIEKIANEKAGIIKNNSCIVTSAIAGSYEVIKKKANERNALLIQLDVENLPSYKDKNIAVAVKAWEYLTKKLDIKISSEINAQDFLRSLQFDGRFQYFPEYKILLDGAHNPQAAAELNKLISANHCMEKIIYIIGMLDKDCDTFLKNLLRKDSVVICTEPKSKRATKKEILANYVKKNGSKAIISTDLREAIQLAKKETHDLIVITGSLYLVGEALELLSKNVIVKRLEWQQRNN